MNFALNMHTEIMLVPLTISQELPATLVPCLEWRWVKQSALVLLSFSLASEIEFPFISAFGRAFARSTVAWVRVTALGLGAKDWFEFCSENPSQRCQSRSRREPSEGLEIVLLFEQRISDYLKQVDTGGSPRFV